MSNDEWPAIFYSPHEDDEAIGMAGAIRQHKDAGRPVYLVLLTDGTNPDMLKLMNGEFYCQWHQTYHHFNLTAEQLAWGRKAEFIASAMTLGVDNIFIVNDAQGFSDSEPYDDYNSFVNRIVETIRYFEKKFPGASHKLTSGSRDAGAGGGTNPTHNACWDAANLLRDEISDFEFYRIYVYTKNKEDRDADYKLELEPEWKDIKKAALEQYKLFLPEAGRYAIGYHSVIDLMDAASEDDFEYVDLLPERKDS